MNDTRVLKIIKKDGGYIVADEDGAEYGPQAATKEEAQQILQDWKDYYAAAQ